MKLSAEEQSRFNEQRAVAIRQHRPLAYFELCVASGVDHRENIDLYHEGGALFNFRRGKQGNASAMIEAMWELPESARYTYFKQHSDSLSSAFDRDQTEKKRLLKLCFPRKFGVGGVQDVSDYNVVDIGVIHKKLLKDAEKYEYDFQHKMDGI